MLNARYTGSIYIAINRVNGRAYIGKTLQPLFRRRAQHKCAATKRGGAFYAAVRRYGWRSFIWFRLYQSDDENCLFEAECQLISDFAAANVRLYNIGKGGEGQSMPCTEERRRKLSATMTGRPKSEAHRRAMSRVRIGTKLSPTTIEKIRAAKQGIKLPAWTPERRAKFMASWAKRRANR